MSELTLDQIELKRGSHGPTFAGDCCAVELSNLIAAKRVIVPAELLRCDRPLEPVLFDDDHPSISRIIRAFVIGLNDAWNDETRQLLKPYAAKILCTATGDDDEETRAWMATDWLVRVHTPAWLRLAGLDEHARALEGLARITDAATARAAQPTIDAARKDAAAVADAARDDAVAAAAFDAAFDAVVDAVGDAAKAAAWDALWSEAGAAAKNAAWDALDAAMVATWAAAKAAAGAAAREAARAAALDAARDAFTEIVPALQASALALLDDMIAVGPSGVRTLREEGTE